jgi:peptidoglycan/LPS O-acetylase OafA/YrhL
MESNRTVYLKGLDGLRALAVTAVLLYHGGLMVGGFLGVEVFFVVSGYLVTFLLVCEWDRAGCIDLTEFWLRRGRRLLPAIVAVTVASLAFAVVHLPSEVAGLRGDALAGLLFVANWHAVIAQQPYFETVGRPSLLKHLWSLGVEGQFYLLWPPMLAIGLRWWTRRQVALAALGGAIGSTGLMALLYRVDAETTRIYYGTDTRASGLLIGAALALAWGHGSTTTARLGPRLLDAVAAVGLAVLLSLLVTMSEFEPVLWRGGMLLVGVATVAVIVAIVHPRSGFAARVLGWAPLGWIGVRSYGIYLWHWPLFALTRPGLDTPLEGAPLLMARLGATLLLADLSYRWIERPVRSGALGRLWRSGRDRRSDRGWQLPRRSAGAAAVVAAGLVLLATSVAAARPPERPAYLMREAIDTWDTVDAGDVPQAPAIVEEATSAAAVDGAESPTFGADPTTLTDVAAAPTEPTVGTTSTPDASDNASSAVSAMWSPAPPEPTRVPTASEATSPPAALEPTRPSLAPEPTRPPTAVGLTRFRAASESNGAPSPPTPSRPTAAPEPTRPPPPQPTPPPPVAPRRVTAIGDSVMLGAAAALERAIDGVAIDAAVSRQVGTALDILRGRSAAAEIGDVVVVHVGNNGTFTARQFDALMNVLSGASRVVVVNLRVPRAWETPNNAVIAAGVGRYPPARLVDWYQASAGRPDLFWDDGIHLRPAGAALYASLVATAVTGP